MGESIRRSGFSRIEVICICGLVAVALVVLLCIGAGALRNWHEGNDSVTVETAKTCAYTELQNECFVIDCPGGNSAVHKTHLDAQGNKRAYFDKVSNCLVGDRPKGYNEHVVAGLNDEQFVAGTAVVEVTDYNNEIVCQWVLGK